MRPRALLGITSQPQPPLGLLVPGSLDLAANPIGAPLAWCLPAFTSAAILNWADNDKARFYCR
jgi:hypothetical protein